MVNMITSRVCRRSFLSIGLIIFGSLESRAEDVVRLATDGGTRTIRGEIVDFTGRAMTIASQGGQPRDYPAAQVVDVQTNWNDDHQAGRDALARHDFAVAAQHLAAANRVEQRAWVRRLILTELMRCYESLGQVEQAGDLFLAIEQSDPATPAYDHAPMAWLASTAVSRGKAEAWLARSDDPAAVLLGASQLMATPAAATAARALVPLLRHPDARVAALAEAQRWRAELMRVTASDAARWAERIEQMPDGVRAGPYFVLGLAYEKLGQGDSAQLAYLRVPVLYAEWRELAARALVAASRISQRSGHLDESALVCREVLARYPDTSSVTEAQDLLESRRATGGP